VYMLKVAPLALGGAYPKGDAILQGGRDLTLLRALDRTAKWLETRFGGVDPALYQFGTVHVTSFADSFGKGIDWGTIPSSGGETTVNVSPSIFYDDDGAVAQEWRSHFGPLVRMTGTFGDDGTPELWFNAPLGNVADPKSAHASDWTSDWRDGRYRRFAYRKSEVEAAAESSYELVWERPGETE
jgi:acyl-homoserine lactone acylase PvdQ